MLPLQVVRLRDLGGLQWNGWEDEWHAIGDPSLGCPVEGGPLDRGVLELGVFRGVQVYLRDLEGDSSWRFLKASEWCGHSGEAKENTRVRKLK